MKRNQSILISLLAAAVTFGSLYAFAGEKYLARHSYERGCYWRNSRHIDNDHWYREGERPMFKNDQK